MGVKVSELGGDNAAGFHLLQTTRTHASSHGVVLRPRQNLGNCLMVARRNSARGGLICQRPQIEIDFAGENVKSKPATACLA